jgi:hypothetical protein
MDWFRHDSNANLDEKLQEVLLDYGLEGYGLYWYCIELIVGKTNTDNITFELKHDARIIARNTGSTPQKVEEMMKRFVSLGLFENVDGKITCLKVAKRLMSSATSNPQMRNLIQNIKISHDSVMTASDKISSDKTRLDKIRLDKNKPSRAVALVNEYVDDGFNQFWEAYPKKVGRDAALKAWEKVKPPIDDVIYALAWQKQTEQWSKNNGQYIPNPSTYLNQGRWKDEAPVEELW